MLGTGQYGFEYRRTEIDTEIIVLVQLRFALGKWIEMLPTSLWIVDGASTNLLIIIKQVRYCTDLNGMERSIIRLNLLSSYFQLFPNFGLFSLSLCAFLIFKLFHYLTIQQFNFYYFNWRSHLGLVSERVKLEHFLDISSIFPSC